MDKIKEKCNKIISNKYFPFFVLVFGMLIIHKGMAFGFSDDAVVYEISESMQTILAHIVDAYYNWSSRSILYFLCSVVLRHTILFRIINVLMFLLLGISISKLIETNNSLKANWMIVSLIFIYPIMYMSSAGWICTCTNYLWALAPGVFSTISIKKCLKNENIKWYEYILYSIALIVGANHEQMCVVLVVTNIVFTIYFITKNKKINWYMLVQSLLSIASLVFNLTCPGRLARVNVETLQWFPRFSELSLFRKLELGFSSTMFEFIFNSNLIFTVFCFILLINVFTKKKELVYRLVASIPFIICMIFGLLRPLIEPIFPFISRVKGSLTEIGTAISLNDRRTWTADLLILTVCIFTLISLYFAFNDKRKAWVGIFIILLGFGSRMIMSFSPTIWASSSRTFLFMYFSIIICTALLYAETLLTNKRRTINFVLLCVGITAILSFINSYCMILEIR